jgi:NDP-sugar pyrophosphorylase family protein
MGRTVKEWFDLRNDIKKFERTGYLSSRDAAERWRFYWSVQDALSSITRYISRGAKLSRSAELSGDVVVERGAQILPNAFIEGPAFVGQGVVVGNSALIRAGSFLSRGSLVGNHCYCTASVLAPDVRVSHFCGVSRSLLARNCYLSAFVVTATTRPDLRAIAVPGMKEEEFPQKIGTLIGEDTYVAPHVVIAPGVHIGSHCVVDSFSVVAVDLESNSRLKIVQQASVHEARVLIKPRRKRITVGFDSVRRQ